MANNSIAIPMDPRPCILYTDVPAALAEIHEHLTDANYEACECTYQMQKHEGQTVVVRAICDTTPACRKLTTEL